MMVVGALVGVALDVLSWLLTRNDRERERVTAFECGFDGFESSREVFDVTFYVVGMLFIVMDIEASFIYPWAAQEGCSVGMWDFIVELLLGLGYVWRVGGLEHDA